jgi:hypothetical protein
MSDVRIGTWADETEMLKLLTLMHQEGGMFDLDINKARQMFSRAFDAKGGILGVIGPPGDVQGAIFLLLTSYWYAFDHTHIEELFCYVRPDHRKSNHANKLLSFAKECSDTLKLPLSIGVLTNQEAEGKLKLYYRKFGTPAGAFFAYGAKWVNGKQPSEEFWKVLFERGRDKKKHNGGKQHPVHHMST